MVQNEYTDTIDVAALLSKVWVALLNIIIHSLNLPSTIVRCWERICPYRVAMSLLSAAWLHASMATTTMPVMLSLTKRFRRKLWTVFRIGLQLTTNMVIAPQGPSGRKKLRETVISSIQKQTGSHTHQYRFILTFFKANCQFYHPTNTNLSCPLDSEHDEQMV